jgi:hypothetical protein
MLYWINGTPKSVLDQKIQNVEGSNNLRLLGFRVIKVSHNQFNIWAIEKSNRIFFHKSIKNVFNFYRTFQNYRFIQVFNVKFFFKKKSWYYFESIPIEFMTFQNKCIRLKGFINVFLYRFLLNIYFYKAIFDKLYFDLKRKNIYCIAKYYFSKIQIFRTIIFLKNDFYLFYNNSKTKEYKIFVLKALEIILRVIYEPIFGVNIYGFSKEDYHIALFFIFKKFKFFKWCINSNILKCFNLLKFSALMQFIKFKISDTKFKNLTKKIFQISHSVAIANLKNGFNTYNNFCDLRLILINICMSQFDKFVNHFLKKFNKNYEIIIQKKEDYQLISYINLYQMSIIVIRQKLFCEDIKKGCIKNSALNSNFFVYIRYLNEWIFNFSNHYFIRPICAKIIILEFLRKEMKLRVMKNEIFINNMDIEKTFFLGTYIFKSKINNSKLFSVYYKTFLEVPLIYIRIKLKKTNFIRQNCSEPKLVWLNYSLNNIIILYNTEFQKYENYYYFAFNRLNFLMFIYSIFKSSCAKLLATKYSLNSKKKVYLKFGKNLKVNKRFAFYKIKF